MPITDNEREGIHVIHNNTFYYIESGLSNRVSSLERLRKILMTRNILNLSHKEKGEYTVKTLQKAKLEKLTIVIIPGSPMIEKLLNEQLTPEKPDKNIKWT